MCVCVCVCVCTCMCVCVCVHTCSFMKQIIVAEIILISCVLTGFSTTLPCQHSHFQHLTAGHLARCFKFCFYVLCGTTLSSSAPDAACSCAPLFFKIPQVRPALCKISCIHPWACWLLYQCLHVNLYEH